MKCEATGTNRRDNWVLVSYKSYININAYTNLRLEPLLSITFSYFVASSNLGVLNLAFALEKNI